MVIMDYYTENKVREIFINCSPLQKLLQSYGMLPSQLSTQGLQIPTPKKDV